MTQEEKSLLLKDLCTRLPYNVIVRCYFVDGGGEEVLDTTDIADLLYNEENSEFQKYKPYLRPMSSMTEEERNEYLSIKMQETERVALAEVYRPEAISEIIDWLNKHHFDYRGLIEKGLALEAPKGMYK